uniref:C3H1-type domain-containing protein n=1 Tax=Nelumbo nucifera TaxID=4432 RepID=A0A822ZH82_NELNU|nr:TPA_asm: hypothetical protein HUJ06_001029 [Nelumbo nucifera]
MEAGILNAGGSIRPKVARMDRLADSDMLQLMAEMWDNRAFLLEGNQNPVWHCYQGSSFTLTSAFDGLEVKNCCSQVLSTSGCPFGESCHFLHYVPGGLSSLGLAPVMSLSAASAAVSQRKSGGPVGDPSVTVSGYKTKLCNKFNTPEGCRFGDKCHFAHGESDLRLPNNQSRGNVRRAPVEGPRGLGPSGFSNSGTDFSNLAAYGNASNFNSQGYGEPNPPGVPANDGSATYETGSIGENVQVY